MSDRTPYRVMTVCTGNICRSPMAELVLRDRFEAAGLGDQVVVDSTGISGEEQGNPMDRRARAVLEAHGYDLRELAGPAGAHRARRVRPADLDQRDLVLPMTEQHARALRRLAPDAPVRMYRTFDPAELRAADRAGQGASDAVADDYRLDIDDPWYGDREDFEVCLAQVEAAADGVVAFVRSELERRNPA